MALRHSWWEMLGVFAVVNGLSACSVADSRPFRWDRFAAISSGPLAPWTDGLFPRGWGGLCMTTLPVSLLVAYALTGYRPALYSGAAAWLLVGFLVFAAHI